MSTYENGWRSPTISLREVVPWGSPCTWLHAAYNAPIFATVPRTVRAPSHGIRACDRPWICLPLGCVAPNPSLIPPRGPLSPAALGSYFRAELVAATPMNWVASPHARVLHPSPTAPCACGRFVFGVFVGSRRPVERRTPEPGVPDRPVDAAHTQYDSSRTSRDAPRVSCVGESVPCHVVFVAVSSLAYVIGVFFFRTDASNRANCLDDERGSDRRRHPTPR